MNLNPGLWIFVESGTQFSSKSNKLQTPCQSSSKELNKQHLCKFSKTHNQFKQTTNVTDEYTPIWIWIEYTNPSSPCPNRITLQQCKENRRTKCYEVEKAVNIASGCTQNHNQVYCFTERMATSCVVHLGWKKKKSVRRRYSQSSHTKIYMDERWWKWTQRSNRRQKHD